MLCITRQLKKWALFNYFDGAMKCFNHYCMYTLCHEYFVVTNGPRRDKSAVCKGESKGADSCAVTAADRRLVFTTVPLLPKSKILSALPFLRLYSLVCVGTGRKP